MAIVYAVGDGQGNTQSLRERLQANYLPQERMLVGFCIMLFCLIATPCVATIAMTKQETGAWRWAAFQFFGLTALAYIITLLTYQLGQRLL